MTVGDRGKYVMLELPSDIVPAGLLDFLFSVQIADLDPHYFSSGAEPGGSRQSGNSP